MAMRIQVRRSTSAEWADANPILHLGEPGWDTDAHIFKIGDGTTSWADLLPTAITGPAGEFIPVIALGFQPGWVNLGRWDSETTYATGDIVAGVYDAYVATAPTTGVDPDTGVPEWAYIEAAYPAWDPAVTYATGAHVADNDNQAYTATAPSTNVNPSDGGEEWTPYFGVGIALGGGASADDFKSLAVGLRAEAGASATAVGEHARADAGGTALGLNARSTNGGLAVRGQATGQQSTAVAGTAGGDFATAVGAQSQANGESSTALGIGAHANNNHGVALGGNASAVAGAIAVGYDAVAPTKGDLNIGGIILGGRDYDTDTDIPGDPHGIVVPGGWVDLFISDDSSSPDAGALRLVARTGNGISVRKSDGTEFMLVPDAVISVNGKVGVVILTPSDVGADAAGAASAAQSAAATDATNKVAAEAIARDTAIATAISGLPGSSPPFTLDPTPPSTDGQGWVDPSTGRVYVIIDGVPVELTGASA